MSLGRGELAGALFIVCGQPAAEKSGQSGARTQKAAAHHFKAQISIFRAGRRCLIRRSPVAKTLQCHKLTNAPFVISVSFVFEAQNMSTHIQTLEIREINVFVAAKSDNCQGHLNPPTATVFFWYDYSQTRDFCSMK
jgi:hypothetical protein